MTPDPRSGRKARENGILGERLAAASDPLIRIGDNAQVLDSDHGIEIKTAQGCVRDGEGERSGRFRFDPEQHQALLEVQGSYRFNVVTPDDQAEFACERPAADLNVPTDRPSTMTLHQVCPMAVEKLSCPVFRRSDK